MRVNLYVIFIKAYEHFLISPSVSDSLPGQLDLDYTQYSSVNMLLNCSSFQLAEHTIPYFLNQINLSVSKLRYTISSPFYRLNSTSGLDAHNISASNMILTSRQMTYCAVLIDIAPLKSLFYCLAYCWLTYLSCFDALISAENFYVTGMYYTQALSPVYKLINPVDLQRSDHLFLTYRLQITHDFLSHIR